jgi:hypothetical protein
MLKILKYPACLVFLAGVGILLGCYIHGLRTNQPTIMSGVAFVRKLPYGEQIAGRIETTVFFYWEQRELEKFRKQYPGPLKRPQQEGAGGNFPAASQQRSFREEA